MGLFDSAQGAGAGVAAATPWGAAASALSSAVNTPNTSASGDITSGRKSFGSVTGGVSFGSKGVSWAWIGVAAAAVATLFFLRKGL